MKGVLKNVYLITRQVLLQLIGFIFIHKKISVSPEEISKILFIRIDRIGDLVLSTPALKALKEKYLHAELTVLASPSNVPVVMRNPFVDHVLTFDSNDGWRGWYKIIKVLRSNTYDLVIDPYHNYALNTAILSFLSGAKFRIGYESYGRGIFYDMAIAQPQEYRHQVDIVLDTLKPIGIDNADRNPQIFLSDEERKWGHSWLEEHQLGQKPIIGIHPGAFYPTQRWPAEYFSELIQQIQEQGKHDVVLFGGPGDGRLLEEVLSPLDHLVACYAGGDLRRFAALLCHCKIFLGNNSGPLHVAVALGIPTISFMGPTVKEIWEPKGPRHRILRVDSLPCIGCGSGVCLIKTHDCMRLLTPSLALEHIMSETRETISVPPAWNAGP